MHLNSGTVDFVMFFPAICVAIATDVVVNVSVLIKSFHFSTQLLSGGSGFENLLVLIKFTFSFERHWQYQGMMHWSFSFSLRVLFRTVVKIAGRFANQ